MRVFTASRAFGWLQR